MLDKKAFETIVSQCSFGDWQFFIGQDDSRLYLQIKCEGVCNVTGNAMNWSGRKWLLSPHMTKSEVVHTTFKAVMTAMEHEVRENFKYKGLSIYDPHYDVDKLHKLRKQKSSMSER